MMLPDLNSQSLNKAEMMDYGDGFIITCLAPPELVLPTVLPAPVLEMMSAHS
jgi:hypothetical protein